MNSHDLLTIYTLKGVEYLLCVVYLIMFIPFWRFVMGSPVEHKKMAETLGADPRPSASKADAQCRYATSPS